MDSWDSEGLWKKAKLFMDNANEHDHASSEFAFFAALSLECLGRSALTKVHPVLNADPREDTNILYACSYSFAKPRSLPAHSVYIRLEKVIDQFQKAAQGALRISRLTAQCSCSYGRSSLRKSGNRKWLARFYDTVAVLHAFLDKPLGDFLGDKGAGMPAEFIKRSMRAC